MSRKESSSFAAYTVRERMASRSDNVTPSRGKTIHVTARVPVPLAARFAEIAEAEYRTVSAELRRLMEQRVAEADKQEVAA